MSDLPAEVFRVIFNNLDRKDITQCLFVCKNWRLQATPYYWTQVTIYSERIKDLKKFLKSSNPNQYFKHGHLTRTVIFEPCKAKEKTADELDFDKFLKRYTLERAYDENRPEHRDPELKEQEVEDEYVLPSDQSSLGNFTVCQVTQLMTYFPNVKEIKIDNHYYSNYLHLLLGSELKHLKKVSVLRNPAFFKGDCDDVHYDFCLLRSDTLRWLKFDYTDDLPFIIENRRCNLYESLSPFKNLTELIFMKSVNEVLTFIQVQEIYVNSRIFCFEDTHRIKGSEFKKQIKRIGDRAIEFNRNLKKLYISIDYLRASYWDYFIKYLPDQLEHFYLYISNLNLYQWMEVVGKDFSIQFKEKFRTIRSFDITFMDKVLGYDIQPSNISVVTTYFTLVNALLGDREAYCIFLANTFDPMSNRFTLDFNKNLILNYGQTQLDLFLNEHGKGDIHLPDKRISTIGFEIINRFYYIYDDDDLFFPRPLEDKQDLLRIIMVYALQNCPNLDHFKVKGGQMGASQIKISPRKGVIVPRSTNNGHLYLKVVKLKFIYNHTKTLESIATYLPDIEILSCSYMYYCRFSLDFDNYDNDFTAFKNLQYFYFFTGFRSRTDSDYILFHFLYTDGEKKTYGFDVANEKVTPLGDMPFNIETIKIKIDKKVQVILYNSIKGAICVIENGQFLNLKYPVPMKPF